ncbi:MAG: AI-2E family transporter [Pseudomonadota bacterium]|nr:AI-2E family transporter [Pseudomonadota bacterium]
MSETQRDVLSACFTLAIIIFAAFVTQRFFLPLVWAGILCIATWPLFAWALRVCGGRAIAAALIATAISALIFVAPLAIGIAEAAHQAPALAALVANANNSGLAAPAWLARVPMAGPAIFDWWSSTLGQPHGLSHLLQDGSVGRLHTASEVLRSFGATLLHRMIDVAFAFLALFFFYKDGPALVRQLDAIGSHCVGRARWQLYATKVPTAIRATVNGLVLVGLAEGVLLGIVYQVAGMPSAVLWAAATGVLAIIPFGAPLAFLCVAGLLAANGATGAAIGVTVAGVVVLFIADHFVRPTIIGNATKLPFLAVLLGILGGVETLGLIGLFIGPVVMTLFVTLWHEEKLFGPGVRPAQM